MLVLIAKIYLYSCMFALVDEIHYGFKEKPKFSKAYVKRVLRNVFFTFFASLSVITARLTGKIKNAFKRK